MLFLLAVPLFPLPKVTACLRAVAEQDTTVVLPELVVLPAAVALCWVLGWRWLREGAVPLRHRKPPQPNGLAQTSGSPSAQMFDVNVAAVVHRLLCKFLQF